MDILGLFLTALNQDENQTTNPSVYDRLLNEQKIANVNPLSQSLPQNMQKIYDTYHSSRSDDFINSVVKTNNMERYGEKRQVPNIIVSNMQNSPSSHKESENNKFFHSEKNENILRGTTLNFEDDAQIEPDESTLQTEKDNDFLLLSKVATLYNQMNNEEKAQKKEKNDKRKKSTCSEEKEESDDFKVKTKKIKKLNWGCGHFEKEHYAKNLCNNCYRKYGRNKKPWNCEHTKLYAHGLCQNCYINKYNQIKRFKSNLVLNPTLLNSLDLDKNSLNSLNEIKKLEFPDPKHADC